MSFRIHFLLINALSFFLLNFSFAADTKFDSFFWLEEVESTNSLHWVNEQNNRSVSELENYPEYKKFTTN